MSLIIIVLGTTAIRTATTTIKTAETAAAAKQQQSGQEYGNIGIGKIKRVALSKV